MAGKVALGGLDGDELWAIITHRVSEHVDDLKLNMLSQEQTHTLEDVRFLQGQIHALQNWLLGLPAREIRTIQEHLRSTRGGS